MWLDAVLAVIFVLSTAQGYRMGFLHTLIHTAGWLASLILGFLWYPKVAEFLREKTDFYNIIYHKIQNKMGDVTLATHDSITDSFPKVLKNAVETVADTFTSSLASGVASFLFNVLAFLLVVLAVRLVFLFLSSLFSKRNNEGLTGFTDGVLGLFAGAFKGILMVFVLLAFLVPIISLSSGHAVSDALDTSVLAGYLYDNNLILLIIQDIF